MSNLLQFKHFVRRASFVVLLTTLACGAKQNSQQPTPAPTAPLPTAGIAGQRVALTPIELVAAEDSLHWETALADRRATLDKCDSIIDALLTARAPEVTWAPPPELRRIARHAPGIVTDPDQMGTPLLRATRLLDVPDPLRSQLRTLMGLVGGRYVLVPAALVYRQTVGRPEGRTATAELAMVLIDSRVGKVEWRTTARGEADDPWTALTRAVKNLTPGVP